MTRDRVALDGHPGVVEFRAAAVRRLWPRSPRAVRALMGSLAQSRRFTIAPDALDRDPLALHRRARRRGRDRRDHPHRAARDRLSDRSAHRRRGRGRREGKRAIRAVPMVVLSTAHPAKFPDAVEAACGITPAAARLARRSRHARRSASPCCRPIRARSKNSSMRRAVPRAKELPHEHGRDTSALRPHGRHRRDAASAKRLARRLGRLRQPRRARRRERHLASARTHGVQGHRAPHRAADRRGDRGGRRRSQRRDQRREHRLLRARAARRRAARARRPVRHPHQSDLRAGGARAREERHRAGDRRDRGHARRPDLRISAGASRSRTSRSAARSSARPRRCARSTRAACAAIWRATIARPTW